MTRKIRGLSEIVSDFDAVLVDQFGVLHDGRKPFPGAQEALVALRARGLPVVALTNSGKRAEANAARLARLGFERTLFREVLSSGELVWRNLRSGLSEGRLGRGSAVLLISRDGDRSVIEDLALRVAAPGAAADLILIAGIEPERITREEYRELLAPCLRRDVPAICANPDHVMYVEDGRAFGPGIVAGDYEAAGGQVTYTGKPSAAFFGAALSALGDPPPERTLMIGDSPHHDIAGAAALGIATMLIEGGVQSDLNEAAVAADFAAVGLDW